MLLRNRSGIVVDYEETRTRHGLSVCTSCNDPKCREEFRCVRCLKWCGFCQGHGEGNECIICEEELRQKLIAFVKSSKWGFRRESALRRHILGNWHRREDREPTMDDARVDDMLYGLVLDKQLVWDPPQDEHSAGEEDLKYRVFPGIRKEKEKSHERKKARREPT